jgi:hypothetical protein
VSADPGIWGWTSDLGRLGFTVTFTLGRDPDDVLRRYGADLGRTEHLDRQQAWAKFPPNYGGAQLRAGMLGGWGFCFEEAGVEGMKTRTLAGLSADTETLSISAAGDRSTFIYLKDAEGIEAFEPGLPYTLRGDEPHKFWAETQKILDRPGLATPMLPAHATLQAIAKYIRALLDRATLEGPLLTAFLADADRAPSNVQVSEPPMVPEPEPEADSPGPGGPPATPASRSPGSLYPASLSTGPLPVTRPVSRPATSTEYRVSGEARAS